MRARLLGSPRRRDLVVLALLGAVLFLPALGARDVWNPDEARYAQVSREMWDGGHVFVPRLNGQVYSEKPPLLFWSMIVASLPVGEVTETTARIPVALAAIAALLLVYRMGERFFGRRAGWLAALAFGTSAKILWQGRFAQIDMLLTALVAAAVWFWIRSYTEERPALALGFFGFAGLATLAKGPVGLLPPLLSVLAFLALTRDREGLRRLFLGRGLLLWLAIVLLWLGPAAVEGGRAYLETMVFKQNVTRYANPWGHLKPWYYYLTVLPADFFPWSFLLPSAVVLGWRRLVSPGSGPNHGALEMESPRQRPGPPRQRDPARARSGFLFALCWVVVTLVFFSLSPAKRTVYLLTLYPALGLLVGAGLDRLAAAWSGRPAADGSSGTGPGASRAWLLVPLGLLTTLLAGLAMGLEIVGAGRPELKVLGTSFLPTLVAVITALALAAAVAFAFAWRRQVVASTASLAAGMGLLILAAAFLLVPDFDAFKSARTLSAELNELTGPDVPYGIYPHLDSTFLFYTGRSATPLESPEELRTFVERPGPAWLLVERDDWRKLREAGDLAGLPELAEVERDADTREGYLLLTEAAQPN